MAPPSHSIQQSDTKVNVIVDMKTFLPARDYELSEKFYSALGFTLNWSNPEVSEFQAGEFRFLLQNFYVEQFASNFMMQLMVDNADDWWERIQSARLAEMFPGSTLKSPAVQPWGLRVLYLSDQSGVLWHIADRR